MSAAGNDPSGQDLIPTADLIALERARIENDKRQIEVAREVIAADERNTQRQFESLENQHLREIELRRAYHKTHKAALFAIALASFLILCFLLYNAFYGEGQQREYGLMIIKYLGIGLAGYGVISGIAGLLKKFLKQGGE